MSSTCAYPTIDVCIFCKSLTDQEVLYCNHCNSPFHEQCIKNYANLTKNKSDLLEDCCLNFLKVLLFTESQRNEDMELEPNHTVNNHRLIPDHEEIHDLNVENISTDQAIKQQLKTHKR